VVVVAAAAMMMMTMTTMTMIGFGFYNNCNFLNSLVNFQTRPSTVGVIVY
jgi:hypothetical protein